MDLHSSAQFWRALTVRAPQFAAVPRGYQLRFNVSSLAYSTPIRSTPTTAGMSSPAPSALRRSEMLFRWPKTCVIVTTRVALPKTTSLGLVAQWLVAAERTSSFLECRLLITYQHSLLRLPHCFSSPGLPDLLPLKHIPQPRQPCSHLTLPRSYFNLAPLPLH